MGFIGQMKVKSDNVSAIRSGDMLVIVALQSSVRATNVGLSGE